MKYYHCNICNEPHAILEESDMAIRRAECDAHGHEGKCVTPPEYNKKENKWHCAYCGRFITEEEGLAARRVLDESRVG